MSGEAIKPKIKKLGMVGRKVINVSNDALVKTSFLNDREQLPLVVEPSVGEIDLARWAETNKEFVETNLLKYRAILFRGFKVRTVEDFNRSVNSTSSGELLEYKDRSSPRYAVGNNIYVSTVYPADQTINLHNEGTYWMAWALKLYFCCLKAPEQGGETPIADIRKVYDRIDPAIREKFEQRQVMYVRNYNQGAGLKWQEAFQTDEKEVIEKYCRDNNIECHWKQGGRLKTIQVRPAVRKHPATGENVWFNHAAFFHSTSLEEGIREALLKAYKEEDLPYNTYYGDGSPIEEEVVRHIMGAYEKGKIKFQWKEGDILMLDNMSVAHAREPYVGERRIIVAMAEPYSPH
jgi:alpha-ketoglutarate-dependent taurine dioxygenase